MNEKDIKIAPWLEKKEKAERSIKGVGFTPRALESLEIVWEQKIIYDTAYCQSWGSTSQHFKT